MSQFLPFFIILLAALFFSEVFYRVHIPWVIALIIGGIIIGPFGLNIFVPDTTIELLGDVGLVFLMFMAGLEIRLSSLREMKKDVARMTFFNGAIPFMVGFGIGLYFDYPIIVSLLIGTIFISSSVAVIIPLLESNKLIATRLGKSIIASTVTEDILSLILVSVLFQSISPVTTLPLPVFYFLLLLALIALRWMLPRLRLLFSRLSPKGLFEWELQIIFVILIGTVILFEILGLHAIIAGFFAGLVLSESIKSGILKGKLRTISYGFFIPIFFVLIGVNTDISIFSKLDNALVLTVVIVAGSIFAKFISGWIAGRINGFNIPQSLLIGGATIPQLSTTLAVAITGAELGILSTELVTAMVVLSIVSTFLSPAIIILVRRFFSDQVLIGLNLSNGQNT